MTCKDCRREIESPDDHHSGCWFHGKQNDNYKQ